MRKICLFLALLHLPGLALVSHAFEVVANGEGRAAIVIADQPSEVAKYAAEEIQYHVNRATGVRLDIVRESARLPKDLNRIVVGPAQEGLAAVPEAASLPENKFRIRSGKGALYLLGNDGNQHPLRSDRESMGTLFAAYEWIQKELGVLWLWPGDLGTVVPRSKHVVSGDDYDTSGGAAFVHSKLRYGNMGVTPGFMSPEAKKKYVDDTTVWLRRHRFVRQINLEYGHGYEDYWDRFGAAHPDWFALDPKTNRRGPVDMRRKHFVQMCVSNPGLHRQIVADWQARRVRQPDLPWIVGMENDRTQFEKGCACPACRAWDPKQPQLLYGSGINMAPSESAAKAGGAEVRISLSDRYSKFWLALQKEGRKTDPNAVVAGYAYLDYSEPPLETKLNENVVLWFVPPYRYPIAPADKERFSQMWDGWRKTGARLILRPNYFLEGYSLPYIFAEEFGREFKHAAANGLLGTDFDSLTGMWGVQGPNLYLLGRLHEKPEMEVQEVLDEYYSGFGKAEPFVRDYFRFWTEVTARATPEFYLKNRIREPASFHFYQHADKIFTLKDFATARPLLDQAAAQAAGDPEVAARVEFLQKGIQQAELTIKVCVAHRTLMRADDDPALQKAFQQALSKLDAYRKQIEFDHVIFSDYLVRWENRTWGRK